MRLLRIELNKSFANKWMVFTLVVGIALAIWAAYETISVDHLLISLYSVEETYIPPSTVSAYAEWMVNDVSKLPIELYFYLVPFLAILPHALTLTSDRASGYSGQLVVRSSEARYVGAKGVAAFVSGGFAAMLPALLNLFICAACSPLVTPDVYEAVQFGVYEWSMWSWIYYNMPMLHCVLRLLLIFVFSGLWAAFVMSLSFVFKRRILLAVVPYLGLLGLKFANAYIFGSYVELNVTPFGFLRSIPTIYPTSGTVAAAWLIALMVFALVGFCLLGRRGHLWR